MTIYFDRIQANSKTNGTQDPTQELLTWLSYKLTDWANKMGPNYVVMIDSHVNWQALGLGNTNTEQLWISLQLKGPKTRAGTNPSSTKYGIAFRTSADLYVYKWTGLVGQNTGTYGNSSFQEYGSIQSSGGRFDNSDFNMLKESFVMYSDTPGKSFFAWNLMQSTSHGMSGVVMEVEDNLHVDDIEDFGWAYRHADDLVFPIQASPYDGQDKSKYAAESGYIDMADRVGNQYLRHGMALRSRMHAYMGTHGDRFLSSGPYYPADLVAAEVDGKQYTHWTQGGWIRTDE